MTIKFRHNRIRESNFPTTEEIGIPGVSVVIKQNGYTKEDIELSIDESKIEEGEDINVAIFELGRLVAGKMINKLL